MDVDRMNQVGVASESGIVYQAGRDVHVHQAAPTPDTSPNGRRGARVARSRSLRRYRRRVAEAAERLPVVFAPTVQVDVSRVYVPLKAVGAGGDSDAYTGIKRARHAVVLGHPGSGKSMLLRHSMLAWAVSGDREQVPVLVDLHRCNGNTASLERLVVDQFDRDGFPGAERFVERRLRAGTLSVLFDGLDEVNGAERERVAQMLRDFVRRHPRCQVVVTCRTAVYDGDLAPEISATFRVLELDERLMSGFLRRWPGLEHDAEHLMEALRANPRIMQLATSPLLLTMIAYLYGTNAHPGGALPGSRAAFYQEATSTLLSRLKRTTNRFDGPVKKAVLKHLALLTQDAVRSDRLTVRYDVALDEVATVLPALSVAASEARAVLHEIVDRSGLLLSIDGGERYQFAHLTLQEYLAAEALADDPEGVVRRYRRAPAEWRETLLLWCGTTAVDVSPVLAAVREIDPILAFECLAHARVVDNAVADTVTSFARDALSAADQSVFDPVERMAVGAVIDAFSAVASAPLDRGRREFAFLARVARTGDFRAHENARAALAATRLPAAADVLFELRAFHHMAGMGDTAVPTLALAARKGSTSAVTALYDMATPSAACALVGLLWDERKTAWQAAWCLAELIADPEVEAALADLPPPVEAPNLPWVWEPFREEGAPITARVMGRVAWLIDHTREADLLAFPVNMDVGLAVPLLASALSEAWRRTPTLAELRGRFNGGTPYYDVVIVDAARDALRTLDEPQAKLRLWDSTPRWLACEVIRHAVFGYRPFRPKDWADVAVERRFRRLSVVGSLVALTLLGYLSFALSASMLLGGYVSAGHTAVEAVVAFVVMVVCGLSAAHFDRALRNPMQHVMGIEREHDRSSSSVIMNH